MSDSSAPDVLIIGAGPVGLTAACELLRHGARVRLVERRPLPVEHSHALAVHVRTQEILDAMGAVAGFQAQGYYVPGIFAHAEGKRLGQIHPTGADSPYSGPLVIGQNHTERLLADHLRSLGGSIEREVEAVAFEQDAQGVRVRLRHLAADAAGREETAAAPWLIDCEGTRSMVRETLGIPFEGERYTGEEFLMADCRVHWTRPHGFASMFYTPERMTLFLPFDNEGFYRVLCMRRDEDPANDAPPPLEEIEAIAEAQADRSLKLSEPTWITRFRTGYRLAARFRDGRAFLAGDTAHAHSPIGGQGMNYGMHDVFNLAWKLAAVSQSRAQPQLLDTYEAERRPVDAAMVHGTDRAFHALSAPHPWAAAAVRLLGPTVLKVPALQHRLRDTVGELNVSYKDSALSEDHGGSHGPAPGERAPDALVVRASDRGRNARLFDVLRGGHWTLLLFAGIDADAAAVESVAALTQSLSAAGSGRLAVHVILTGDPPPAGAPWADAALMDAECLAHEKYGVGAAPCLYLVRPDWYVGFRGKPGDAERLRAYLDRVLPAANGTNL